MNYNELIATIGVGIILIAYFLNNERMIARNGQVYYVLNIIGAGLACYASILINFWPFVILEGTWTLVSIWGWMKSRNIEIT